MTIAKGQLAGLLNGLGSSYASSGGYTGQRSLLTIGAILEAPADEIVECPTETYEIPPARTKSGAPRGVVGKARAHLAELIGRSHAGRRMPREGSRGAFI